MPKILLVEDNEDDIELTIRAFQRINLADELAVARDGDEALTRLLSDSEELPAVVLLDLKLPKVDGFEVLAKLRDNERTRLLPVVVLTSSAQERDMLRTYSLGANSYIVKPVDFEQFITAAREIGVYWLLLNRRPPEGHVPHPVR